MKIILDTNIVFSALLNTNSQIADVLMNSKNIFEFYSSDYLRYELLKHQNKILNISKLSEIDLKEAEFRIFKHIDFINIEIINLEIWEQSYQIVKAIDLNDIEFIALAIYLDAAIWTGDKKLYNGLKSKNFNSVLNTQELIEYKRNQL